MSLFKQLFIAICVLMLVNFTGSFLVSVESSREQQVNQLRAHAQDAATALGLSLSPHVNDTAMIELMVSSIFDSGYFESIRVTDPATGELLVERSGVPVSGEAPQWFAQLVDLDAAQGDAIVSDGWRQAAQVQVISHPLFAVSKLWQSTLGNLLWLTLSGVLCIALGVLLLKRQLRPLDYMVAQSNAIARREFLSLPELPKTPEFRRVVNAMNQMVGKLKAAVGRQSGEESKGIIPPEIPHSDFRTPEYAAFADSRSAARREAAYKANQARIEESYRTQDATMSPAAIKQAWIKDTPLGKLEHNTAWGPNGELGRWAATLPAVRCIDTRRIKLDEGLSPALQAAMAEKGRPGKASTVRSRVCPMRRCAMAW